LPLRFWRKYVMPDSLHYAQIRKKECVAPAGAYLSLHFFPNAPAVGYVLSSFRDSGGKKLVRCAQRMACSTTICPPAKIRMRSV
jgi:hypothetical protein